MNNSKNKMISVSKRRAPNLTPDLIKHIVEIIRCWNGRLTWDLIIENIEQTKYATYTRQALAKHKEISDAYRLYQENSIQVEKKRRRNVPVDILMLQDELIHSKNEINRLKAENRLLMSQFVRWAYNATQRGITEDYLNQPLPERPAKLENKLRRLK